LLAQGLYFLVTGVWPLVHLRSFLAVTGPKTDIWLLKTLSLMICAVGGVLLLAGLRGTRSAEVRRLSGGSALTLLAADVYYVSRGTVSPVYLMDAIAEAPFVAAWAFGGRDHRPEDGADGPNATSMSTAASIGSSPNSRATSSS
jgi:hypothetical protein